ncbi:3-deoxy-7-phosphoheptulonate synthase [Sutterella sp.]|uniref:3-deoxy-7-phosphoheptulonate synthase n=1 Tax=Sutterella sp. TaxID=1981025 RepID=UPI0026E00BE4|nr:3-deoxy-7-phosphoheptulonate synthase [Sutterella sp.]MDO5532215.1 3-deoxy-7-phosphoheptulonate synthase [Sutterella sp.]
MILILKADTTKSDIADLKNRLEARGLRPVIMEGAEKVAVGIIGETRSHLPADQIQALPYVETIRRVSDPYKLANRVFHPEDTVVDAGGALTGGGNFSLMAGPCSIESREQIVEVAKAVKAAGATMLRGGAFKPRTSPYDFQGLRGEGLKLMLEAKRETGLPIVTEIMSIDHLPLFEDVDMIQVGARSMQNFEMLKELGKTKKPILLKRGLSATIKELLMAAEYIMASGNDQIVLCERGIRTYETATRNTLDLSAIAVLHERTHLPVVIDPSHATGVARYVPSMAAAAAAAGCDGLMIEVHNNPAAALCDGPQSITPDEFVKVVRTVKAVRAAVSSANAIQAKPISVEQVIRACAS